MQTTNTRVYCCCYGGRISKLGLWQTGSVNP